MSLVQKMWQRAGVAFRAKVGKELSGHGLLYEDVLVETEEVPAALPCLQLGLALVQPRPPLHIPPSPRSRAPVAVLFRTPRRVCAMQQSHESPSTVRSARLCSPHSRLEDNESIVD